MRSSHASWLPILQAQHGTANIIHPGQSRLFSSNRRKAFWPVFESIELFSVISMKIPFALRMFWFPELVEKARQGSCPDGLFQVNAAHRRKLRLAPLTARALLLSVEFRAAERAHSVSGRLAFDLGQIGEIIEGFVELNLEVRTAPHDLESCLIMA